MRRLIGILACFLALAACQKPLFDPTPRWMRMQDRFTHFPHAPEEETPDSLTLQLSSPGVFAVAVRFPEWADWREGDYRGAEAVLFKDSTELLSFPFRGDPAPDRICLLDGALWIDQTLEGRQTAVLRNGEMYLRYDGEEVLKGLLPLNGHLHTLGQRAGGKGLCYRIDGVAVFSSPVGNILGSREDREWPGGALAADSSGVYYSYSIPVQKGEETQHEYRIMRGAELVQTLAAGLAHTVFDIRPFNGVLYRSECRTPYSWSLCLVMADTPISMNVGEGESVSRCRLVPYEGEMVMKGYSTGLGGGKYTCWVRDHHGLRLTASSNNPVADLFMYQGSSAYITLDEGRVYQVFVGGVNTQAKPHTYLLKSARCAVFQKGTLAMALSHATGTEHRLWVNGKIIPLTFNGYFAAIQIQ